MTLYFLSCRVVVWSADYLETVFEDGLVCPALFSYDDHAQQTARDLGYGSDVRLMHYHHEILHTVVAEQMGDPYSRCLHAAAERHRTGAPWTFDADRDREENMVLEFQRYLNTGTASSRLAALGDLRSLAERFYSMAHPRRQRALA